MAFELFHVYITEAWTFQSIIRSVNIWVRYENRTSRNQNSQTTRLRALTTLCKSHSVGYYGWFHRYARNRRKPGSSWMMPILGISCMFDSEFFIEYEYLRWKNLTQQDLCVHRITRNWTNLVPSNRVRGTCSLIFLICDSKNFAHSTKFSWVLYSVVLLFSNSVLIQSFDFGICHGHNVRKRQTKTDASAGNSMDKSMRLNYSFRN